MKKISVFFATLSFAFSLQAQDPVFLNTNQSLVYLNPSFAGSNGGIRNQLSLRNQWPQSSGHYVTYLNSFDAYLKPLKAGVAVSYAIDDIAKGTLKTSAVNASYAQYLSFGEGKLKVIPSIQVGYGLKSLDRENLHYGDAIDARNGIIWNNPTGIPLPTKSYFNMSGGLLVNYKKDLYVGAYIFNFNQPDVGMLGTSKLPYRLLLHASYNFHVTEQTNLQVSYRYNRQQLSNFNQIAANAIFKNHFIAGLGLASNYTPILNLGYRYYFITVQGGYDFNVSRDGIGRGAWEFHLSFNFGHKDQFKAHRNFENW